VNNIEGHENIRGEHVILSLINLERKETSAFLPKEYCFKCASRL